MSVTSIRGLKIWLQKKVPTGDPSPRLELTVGDISTAGVMTFDSTQEGIVAGDILLFESTGYDNLDGKILIAGTVDATTPESATVQILGTSRFDMSGAYASETAIVRVLHKTNLVQLCLSTMTVSAGSANTIDVSTFCNQGAALPGNPTAGSITFAGYTDIEDAGYLALLDAQDDAANRLFKIDIPNQGSQTGEVAIGDVTWDYPLEGSSGYSFNATMATPLRHVF